MKTSEYQKMSKLEGTYWWHVGRKYIIDQQLKKYLNKNNSKILNIGCGTGGMITLLEKHGLVTNVDVSNEAIKFARRMGFKNLLKYDGKKLPFKDSSFDLVVATDVLEHIDNDDGALKEWARVLKKDGILLITVPAYKWLWSNHDESLHHFRRYTAHELAVKINRTRLNILTRTYCISFSFPLIAGFRALEKTMPNKTKRESSYVKIPKLINDLFIYFLRVESLILKKFNLPVGTSILVICKKT
jgi:ubiquinone/menaquinone biosynthesis C-methylase UbiE